MCILSSHDQQGDPDLRQVTYHASKDNALSTALSRGGSYWLRTLRMRAVVTEVSTYTGSECEDVP